MGATHKSNPNTIMEWYTGQTRDLGNAAEAKHGFQAVLNLPFEDVDCFSHADPTIVPVKIFL